MVDPKPLIISDFFDDTPDEYREGFRHGGKWYYSQNKPGTPWFDGVSNESGWTVDFNLEVIRVENANLLSETNPPDGLGIYVNDGIKQESIYFFEQEIVFLHSSRKITFDTTQETNYRLTGKNNSLKLHVRRGNKAKFELLAEVPFTKDASNEGNSFRPSVYEDSNGEQHAVWHDDGNVLGQILYSKFDGTEWSEPETVLSTTFGAANADLVVDSNGLVYVVFESKETDTTSISFMIRNDIGWSKQRLLGSNAGESRRPRLSIDSEDNVHIVWEDHRFGHPEVFYNKFNSQSLSFIDDVKITNSDLGSFRPVVSTYFNVAYIAWVKREEEGSIIQIASFDQKSDEVSDAVNVVDNELSKSDFVDIISGISGKIYLVWHDKGDVNEYLSSQVLNIFSRIYNIDLEPITGIEQVSDTDNNSKFPVLSQRTITGNIFVVWEEDSLAQLEPDPYQDPYLNPDVYLSFNKSSPCNTLLLAQRDNVNSVWISSANGKEDVLIVAPDARNFQSPAVPSKFSNLLHILYVSTNVVKTNKDFTRFAVIGDYGASQLSEQEFNQVDKVSSLVKSFDPDFILTVGDNDYETFAEDGSRINTLDQNIGQFYSDFIGNYKGDFGPGSEENRFFPTLGNHDLNNDGLQNYLSYFDLPGVFGNTSGNERYYKFRWKNIELFALNSDDREPDGNTENSVQAIWLRDSLAASTATFKIVYFHHNPFGSDEEHALDENKNMRWPFKDWGADIVISGHLHLYERLFIDNFNYLVVGTGGRNLRDGEEDFGQMSKISKFGSLIVDVDERCAIFNFFDADENLLDSITIQEEPSEFDPYFTPEDTGPFLPDEYLLDKDVFSHIKDVVFDVSGGPTHIILSDEDLLVSNKQLQKEIRFGDFSNVLSAKFRFKDFKYYLSDSVPPFNIVPLSNKRYEISDVRSQDAVVNNTKNSWVATPTGLLFYFNPEESLTKVQSNKDVRSIAFDKNNILFYAWFEEVEDESSEEDSGFRISYSVDHINHFNLSLTSSIIEEEDILGTVTSMSFDKNNKLVVGTKNKGIIIIEIAEDDEAQDGNVLKGEAVEVFNSVLPSLFVTSLKIDDINAYWAGTRNGLVRILNGQVSIFNTSNGLPSNRINDIAIRNTAIRYIATANGLSKMTGTAFNNINVSKGQLANNNVKSVAWQNPNIIWAGTLSKLNQILEQPDGTFVSKAYNSSYYSLEDLGVDDRKNFFVVAEEDAEIDKDAFVEVFINGHRISHGFKTSITNRNAMIVQFDTELLEDDVVDIVIRNDLTLLASFEQLELEKEKLGLNVVRIKQIATDGESVYIVTEGDENIVKLNDSSNSFPHDLVHFDVNPPKGCLRIAEVIDNTTVRVLIEDVDDGEKGSGLGEMVLSTRSNFTTDGVTPVEPVPFSPSSIVDLGLSFGEGSILAEPISETFIFPEGRGTILRHFNSRAETYAGTEDPAQLFKRINSTGDWELVTNFGEDRSIDFIERFNGLFVVGIGNLSGQAEIHSFVDDGSFSNPTIVTLTGTRAFAAREISGVLYIASGPDGKLYGFDGQTLSVVLEGVGDNIFDLTVNHNELFAATGTDGRVYRIDPIDKVAMISHTDSDGAVSSIRTFPFSGKTLVFAGTSSEGKILRSEVQNASFNVSFKGIPSKVSSLDRSDKTLFAAVGDTVYSFKEETPVWVWRFTNNESVNDVAGNASNGTFFIISDSKINRVGSSQAENETDNVKVFLKLIDRAGNESQVFDDSDNLVPCFFDSITLEEISESVSGGSFFNENKILELDELGTVTKVIDGESKFFSADKIEVEKGEYFSQIFNGTNDLIKWDVMSWIATQPSNTEVQIFVRTSDSETDILNVEWVGPFDINDSTGIDISFLSGQFLQFRAVLISREKGISPSLRNVVIRSVTSEAVHFFTTNFILPSRLRKGILTGEKMLPVASDIVFGVNTTDSVNWSDYQVIEDNRLFNSAQFGENLRVGVRLITPSKSALMAAEFDEYGPYNSDLFINTIDFSFLNEGSTADYHFRITLFSDIGMTNQVFQAFSSEDQDGFNLDGASFPSSGVTLSNGESADVFFAIPNAAGLNCNEFFFAKIEAYDGVSFTTISDSSSFILGCSASFVNDIDFDFTNETGSTSNFHFRVKFFNDPERTDLFLTEFSGNNRTGWFAGSSQIPEGGVNINPSETKSISFSPDLSKLVTGQLYYLTIDAFDGTDFTLASNSFTFQATSESSLIYCGPYIDVPVLKNFALMFELINNEFVTLNLD